MSNDWHLDPQSCLRFRKDDSAIKACFTCQSHHWFLLLWPVFPTYAAYMFVYRRVISLNSLSFLSDHMNKCFSHTSFCKQHAGVDTQQVPRSFLHFPRNISFWALTTIQPSRFDILPARSRKYLSKEHCSWVVFTPSYAFHRRSRHLSRQRGIMEVFITIKIQFLLMTSKIKFYSCCMCYFCMIFLQSAVLM